MLKRSIIILFAAITALNAAAQDNYLQTVRVSKPSPAIFDKVTKAVEPYKDEPANQLIVRIAKEFLGTEYVGGTLEIEPEQLTINMDKTDCILFVEMCLALTRTIQGDDPSFENFCRNTQKLRYRGGVVDGYSSRNHYTSGWILQGEENGIFKEISKDLGGAKLDQHFDFMSSHLESYMQLKDNPGMVVKIMQVEKALDQHDYYYLPQNNLTTLAKGIREGDIICFVTPVGGLDIGHVAIAIKGKDGKMHFIHASSAKMKVIIDQETIADYVNSHKSTKGVRVVRLN